MIGKLFELGTQLLNEASSNIEELNKRAEAGIDDWIQESKQRENDIKESEPRK